MASSTSTPDPDPSPPLTPNPPPPPFDITDESSLLKYTSHYYAHISFEQFSTDGYVDFAYTVENWRWTVQGQGDCMPLGRKMMDRLWVGMVMEFWVRLEWLWEGEEEVEGVVIALLEREDGPGVEDMWEDRKLEYPGLDTRLYHPIVGHCGLFEDYLDLRVRAVINPEIRCYLEKAEDGAVDREETELGMGVAGLGVQRGDGENDAEGELAEVEGNGDESVDQDVDLKDVEIKKEDYGSIDQDWAKKYVEQAMKENDVSVDQDGVEKDVQIKKEDDGTQIATDGVGEAISLLSLARPVGNDAVNQETVHIKTEKGIKIEKDGTGSATYTPGNAIPDLPLTGLVQNSHSDTQVTVKTEPGIATTIPLHGVQTLASLANPHITFRVFVDIIMEPVSNPLNRPHGLGHTASVLSLATSASNHTSTLLGFSPRGCGASRTANMIGEAMSKLAINETPAVKSENRAQQEWQARFPRQLPLQLPLQARPTRVIRFCDEITASQNPTYYYTTGKVWIMLSSKPVGATGIYKNINQVSHFFPLEASPSPKGACICGTFDYKSPAVVAAPSFWDTIVGCPAISLMRIAAEAGVYRPVPLSQAETSVYNPTPVFQAQPTAPIPAPAYQGHNGFYNPAPAFQARLPVHNWPASNQAQGAAHNPAPYYQAQAPIYNSAHGFQAQVATNGAQPLFRAASYSAASSGLGFETSPAASDYSARALPTFNSVNFLRSSTAPAAYGHGFNLPATDTRPLFNPVVYSRPQPPPMVYTFINHTAETMRAQELAEMRKSQGLLDVGKMRQIIKTEEDDDVKIKVEPEASCSVPALERKRARDVDSDYEKLELERPRKVSG